MASALPEGSRQAIGPYRLTGLLGEGGMGLVYSAEQLAPIRRQVALKVVRTGLGSDEILARFQAERQALAVMEHPGIAKVLDAGTTDDKLPYFVMELVDGIPFTAWCDEHRLSTRERIRLFIPLCHAIQHAHQKGVIHRDLKPSNVLVTAQAGEAQAKVIDFGIAKAINLRLTEQTLVTEAGMAVGTPAYMSPEQAEGSQLDIDTRTDVYALGVMLYEVLAGSLPVDPTKLGLIPFIAQLMARLTDPPSPSVRVRADPATVGRLAAHRATDPVALARELRGDLDAITLKAMAPERERRYQSAAELAHDLERFLANEPVSARAPSLGYRAGKLARRRPTAVALAASAVVFLVGLTVVSTIQARRIARARAVAEQRRSQAEDLLGFMIGDLRGKLEPIGRLALLDDVGKRAMTYFASVPADELTDEELFRRSQALSQLAQVRLAEGNMDEAMKGFRESLAQVRDLVSRDPDNAEWLAGLGASHFWVGYVHYDRSQHDSALAQFEPYLELSRRLVARDSTNPEWQLEVGYAHSNIGSVHEARGEWEKAIEAFRYTLDVKKKLVALDSSNLDWRVDLGVSHNTLGRAHERNGALDSAQAHYLADLAISESVARRDSSNAKWQERLSGALSYAARVSEARGRLPEAAASYGAALRVMRGLVARDSTNANWGREEAVLRSLAARVQLARGDVSGALAGARTAHRLLDALARRDTSNADFRAQLAIAEIELGRSLDARGEHAAARRSLESAEARLAGLVRSGSANQRSRAELGRARVILADLLMRDGVRDRADAARRGALDALGADATRDDLGAVEVRARALAGLGRDADAAPLFRRLRDAGVVLNYTATAFPRW